MRSAFVVLEDGVSKGVGYVSFAIKEDAGAAMQTIEAEGLTLVGRKIRVQWADHKVSRGEHLYPTDAVRNIKRELFAAER